MLQKNCIPPKPHSLRKGIYREKAALESLEPDPYANCRCSCNKLGWSLQHSLEQSVLLGQWFLSSSSEFRTPHLQEISLAEHQHSTALKMLNSCARTMSARLVCDELEAMA